MTWPSTRSSETRFAVLSINDVPEAWELYSRAGSITRLCSGKNGSKPELLVVHPGNPVCGAGMAEAILLPAQDCQARRPARPHQARTRPAPGPHQARTKPAPGPHQARQARARPAPGTNPTSVWSEVGFPISVEKSSALRPKPRSRPCSDQSRGAGLAFPSLLRTFRPQKSSDEAVR